MMIDTIDNKKSAHTKYEIIEAIQDRWSPRAFSDEPVSKEALMPLFEAARWAASSYNEQPWRFVVGIKGDAHYDRLFSILNEWNQKWAEGAPVLVLTIAKKTFSHNGNNNAHAWHDVGAAMANFSTQATAEGLYVHQMAGIHRHLAVEEFISDDDFEVVAMAAVGYLGAPSQLPEDMAKNEKAPRKRKEIEEVVDFA